MTTKDLNIFIELTEYLLQNELEEPVAPYLDKDQLSEQLDLELQDKGVIDEELIRELKKVLRYTPKTASKSFFNQLFGGRIPKASLGELLSVMLNNSMYTYKVAGPQVGIEKEVIKQICRLIDYPSSASGTFAPGGSMTNMMALIMARDKKNPKIRESGNAQGMVLYTSAESHYSIEKNAALCGLGRSSVRKVHTDEKGEMLCSHLKQLIEDDLALGLIPFFVNATAGTTVLGAFDQLKGINEICKAYNLWCHVDGAYCGGVIFSSRYRRLLANLNLTDSFSFNAHKMLGTPLSCSIIVTPHKDQLHHSFSNEADYLYQTANDDFNLGKISMQCGRRNDALKIWTLWKSVGLNGLERIVDQQFTLANIAREYIKSNDDYTLYSFDDSISVCFNYKNLPAKDLCTALYTGSELMVGFGSRNGIDFVRLVTINTSLDEESIINFFKTLEAMVKLKFTEIFVPSNPEAPNR